MLETASLRSTARSRIAPASITLTERQHLGSRPSGRRTDRGQGARYVPLAGIPVPGESMAPEGLKPRSWMSNIGCYRWSGAVSGSTSPSALGPLEEITAQVTFVRDYRDVPEVMFTVAEGSFTWRTWGTWSDCSYRGAAAWTSSGPQEGMLRFCGGHGRRWQHGLHVELHVDTRTMRWAQFW